MSGGERRRAITSIGVGELILWDASTAEPIGELLGRDAPVVARMDGGFSPDGRWLVGGMGDGSVRVWNADSGAVHHSWNAHAGESSPHLAHLRDDVRVVQLSPDGRRVLTIGLETSRLWSFPSGELLRTLRQHDGKLRLLSASRYLVAGKGLSLWNADTGERVADWSTQRLAGDHAWRRDGKRIVAQSKEGAWLLDGVSGRTIAQLAGLRAARRATFSEDGSRVLVAHEDEAVVFDAHTGKALRSLRGHQENVDGIALSQDGRLAAVTAAGYADVWKVASGQRVRLEGQSKRPVRHPSFSPDGSLLVASEPDQLVVWRVSDGKVAARLASEDGIPARFADQGREIVAVRLGSSPAFRYAVPSFAKLPAIGGQGQYVAGELAMHGRGSRLAVFGKGGQLIDTATWKVSCNVGERALGDGDCGLETRGLGMTEGGGFILAKRTTDCGFKVFDSNKCEAAPFLPDEDLIVAPGPRGDELAVIGRPDDSSSGSRLWIHDRGGAKRLVSDGLGSLPRALAWSSTKQIAAYDAMEGLQLVDVPSGKVRVLAPAKLEGLHQRVVFNRDGSLVAATGRRGSFAVWQVASGALAVPVVGPGSGPFLDPMDTPPILFFSPDGRSLVKRTVDGALTILDVDNERTRKVIGTAKRPVTAAAFTADGRYLLVAVTLNRGLDKPGEVTPFAHEGQWRDIVIFDAATRSEVKRIAAHTSDVRSFASPADGRYFISSASSESRIWSLPPR